MPRDLPMTPCSGCGGDARRFESPAVEAVGGPIAEERFTGGEESRVPTTQDLTATGLSEHGIRTLGELGKRLDDGRLTPLYGAIDELREYVGLLHTAAAGNALAVNAFRKRVLSTRLPDAPLIGGPDPGRSFLSPFGDRLPGGGVRVGGVGGGSLGGGSLGGGSLGGGSLGGGIGTRGGFGRKPFPMDEAGPCGIGAPHPFTFFAAGLNASGVFEGGGSGGFAGVRGGEEPWRGPGGAIDGFGPAFTWIDRGFAGWATRAVGIEVAIGMGRRWLDGGGDPADFLSLLGKLGSIGELLPGRPLPSMCLSEYQVCISEFLFTAMPLVRGLYAAPFPPLGSLSPADQCTGTAGPISMFPPAGAQYPAQADIQAGTFVAIDRAPATVLSWTPQEIRLELPAGISAGCHSVGWVHVFDPDAVNQIRGIGEQCRPFFATNTLVSAPYAIWADQGFFSIIEAPIIDMFNGPNGSQAPNAEACTPVMLNWATSVASCSGSAVQVDVSLLRDGQLFRTALPDDGQLPVSDATGSTYTLRAQAKIGNQLCGLATKTLTISRFNQLRVQAQGDTHCADKGVGVSLEVRTSCPAPPGGLPVTVTSSDASRVANAAGTIDEGNDTTIVEAVTGSQCGTATLTVTVPNHPQRQLNVTVASDPVITSVTPTTFQTCDPVQVIINGSCLGETAAELSATIDVNGQTVAGTVAMLAVGTQVRIDFPPLPAGTYPLALSHCSRIAFATSPLIVTTRLPSIASLTSPTNQVEICTSPAVRINWSVRDAVRVVLMRGATQVVDRMYPNPCSTVTDTVTDNLPVVTAGVSYVMTAFNAEGAAATRTLNLPPASQFPIASTIIATNNSGSTRNVFLFDGVGGGAFFGAMTSGQTVSIPVPQCFGRMLVSIDPAAVAQHNADFNDNLSPTSVAVASTSGPWTRTTTGVVLGLNGAAAVGVSV